MRLHTVHMKGRLYVFRLGYLTVSMTGEAKYCTHVKSAVCGWVRLHTVHVRLAG